jgi:epoxyqueuosine reductase
MTPRTLSPSELTAQLIDEARRLGFDMAGACYASTSSRYDFLKSWIAEQRHASMEYMASRIEAYASPSSILPNARSILMLGVRYSTKDSSDELADYQIAKYAQSGIDYHDWVRERLKKLSAFHRELTPHARVRGVVDTAPLLERDYAKQAGLGWIGKNTLLINPQLGSGTFLAALLTTEELGPSRQVSKSDMPDCGSCRKCLDACPTGALEAPYVLNANRCLSYLTIEHKGPIEDKTALAMGDQLFGCDRCQDVCPWNKRLDASAASESAFPSASENGVSLDPIELLSLDEDTFRERFKKTPFARPGRSAMLRNAAIVLGNRYASSSEIPQAVLDALQHAANDADAVISNAAHWALKRITG